MNYLLHILSISAILLRMKLEIIIGNNVRGFRNRLNVSQEKLAEYADVHRTFIGTIERAEQSISVSTISKLAKALKVDPFVLLIKDSYLHADQYQK
jgi:transcriptional regulator with XRE-family HTH domain